MKKTLLICGGVFVFLHSDKAFLHSDKAFFYIMKLNKIIFFFLLFTVFISYSQSDALLFDNDLLTKEFHQGRRDALRRQMEDSSVAVFFANPVRNRANDVNYQYHQDPNFYYLTGFTESNAILLVFKEPHELEVGQKAEFVDEIIFVQPRNPNLESWSGRRLGTAGVKLQLGVKAAMENNQFAEFNIDFSKYKKVYHLPLFNDVRDDENDKGDIASLIKYFNLKTNYPKQNKENYQLTQIMAGLREIKQPEEIVLIKKAIQMTCIGHRELMKALEPNMSEYQAQAILEYYFKNGGSECTGYPSIVGGGANSCILHYTANRKALAGKDMLVFDAGAEYHGYTADVTRTLPADGKFSKEEKIIYNIVLEAQLAGIAACRAGNEFRAAHKAAVTVIQKRLLEYGIIKTEEEYSKYFFHGTSHYLGLDVHDAGLFGKLAPGNIITVEPGIYIPAGADCDLQWWNIGVRIEDDILITEEEPEVLSGSLPKLIEELEAIMLQTSMFNKK